ncbi:MAG: AAA family ATPase [Epsilonproteobacteria bacterium]|nr:AAA family ATPase [Campylobacterota bacterium]
MKILKLSFKNINSLKGNFEIDFERFEDGIFAITGATGAGKSTILDAICASMYAKTPRLTNKNVYELMSKHTGDLFCETLFEINGKRYKSRYSLKRARGKSDGNLQPPKMLLSDEDGNIIEESVKKVPKKIEELSGLDFERFTKSIILSQGNFDAFLKASSNEKAELLEKITSAQIYSLISQKVYNKHKEKKLQIEFLKEKIENIELLSEEESKNLHTQKTALLKEKEEIEKISKNLREEIQNLKKIEELLNKQKLLLRNKESLKREIKSNEERFEKYQKAKKAKKIIREWQNYLNKKEELKALKKKIQNFTKIDSISTESINNLINDIKNQINAIKEEKEKKTKKLKSYQKIEIKKTDLSPLLLEKENILKQEKKYEEIKRDFIKISTLNEKISLLQKTKNQKELSLKDKITKKELLLKDISSIKELLEEKEKRRELGLKIISLEEERKKLTSGSPCPLCGSTSHPWADKKSPDLSKLDKEIAKKKREFQEYQNNLISLEKEIGSLQSEISGNLDMIKEYESEIEKLAKNTKEFENIKELEGFIRKNEIQKETIEKKIKEAQRTNEEMQAILQKISTIEKDILKTTHEIKDKENFLSTLQEFEKDFIKIQKEKNDLKEIFLKKANEEGFENQEEFKEALLDEREMEEIERLKNRLDKERIEIESKLKELSKELEGKDFDENRLLEKENILKEYLSKYEKIIFDIASIEERFKIDSKNREKIENLNKNLQEELKEFEILDILNSLIGSAQGDKYRKFASSITLDILIEAANRHLKVLNERYLLKRSQKELDIEILDTYQANIQRPINTLSGGESFIVSLSLALALSDLVSEKVKIGSLFLDEGFGTLDSESLEAVLFALNNLKNQGRNIGIISHVEALKDRISKKIKVIKLHAGESRIEIEY